MQGSSTVMARYTSRRGRLELTFAGEVDGPAYRRCMAEWLQRHPEAVSADWIYDLRDYRGTVSHDDVLAFTRLYDAEAGERDRGARSVFITPDPGFRYWVQACAAAFPRRVLTVVDTLAGAEALLAAERAAA
jgi:hypothetical protein